MEKELRSARYAQDIARMLQLETVKRPGSEEAFAQQRALLAEFFPRIHADCRQWEFDGSLLFCWPGQEHEDALLLMSHQDVVEAPGQWSHPPFAGEIADGKLWGRGALDVKANLYCILRAVEELMEAGVTPRRDVYIASSDREELGGNDLIVDFLRQQGITIGLLVDEGTPIMDCPIPGIPGEFALISMAEKGYADIKCIARSRGGHASAPGKGSPLPRLGAFMCRIDEQGLFPPTLNPACAELYRRLADRVGGERGALMAHLEDRPEMLEQALDEKQLALLTTTTAFTMASGSTVSNVMPREAWVMCNVRIAPGTTVADVMDAMGAVAAECGVELELQRRHNDPSPVTSPDGPGFRAVERALAKALPGVEPLPFLLAGGTDTKHFVSWCPNCLRFTPLRISAAQWAAVHGVDESIDVAALPGGVDFFKALIQEF